MAWERMELYLNEHPDVARHIAANVTLFDEKKIEFLNAKIGRWFNPRTPNASIDDYTKVTSILKGVEEITRALDELLLRRAPQAKESDRLRASYLSPAWTETHEKFDASVLNKFQAALNGEAPEWAVRGRLSEGMEKIKLKVLPELKEWARKQRALRAGPPLAWLVLRPGSGRAAPWAGRCVHHGGLAAALVKSRFTPRGT